jgi:hypothetical protein
MQGMLQDAVGAVIEQLEQWNMPSRQTKTVGEQARASGSISGGRQAGHCSVWWKGVQQHSMFWKTAQEIVLKEVQENFKLSRYNEW